MRRRRLRVYALSILLSVSACSQDQTASLDRPISRGKNCLYQEDDLTKLVQYLEMKNFQFEKEGQCIFYDGADSEILTSHKLELFGTPPPSGRSTSFGERNSQIREKLEEAGIHVSIKNYRGTEYLVWSDEAVESVEQILNRPAAERELMRKMRDEQKDD